MSIGGISSVVVSKLDMTLTIGVNVIINALVDDLLALLGVTATEVPLLSTSSMCSRLVVPSSKRAKAEWVTVSK